MTNFIVRVPNPLHDLNKDVTTKLNETDLFTFRFYTSRTQVQIGFSSIVLTLLLPKSIRLNRLPFIIIILVPFYQHKFSLRIWNIWIHSYQLERNYVNILYASREIFITIKLLLLLLFLQIEWRSWKIWLRRGPWRRQHPTEWRENNLLTININATQIKCEYLLVMVLVLVLICLWYVVSLAYDADILASACTHTHSSKQKSSCNGCYRYWSAYCIICISIEMEFYWMRSGFVMRTMANPLRITPHHRTTTQFPCISFKYEYECECEYVSYLSKRTPFSHDFRTNPPSFARHTNTVPASNSKPLISHCSTTTRRWLQFGKIWVN